MVNQSNESFTEEQLLLLNKGLNYAPRPKNVDLLESIVDIETILKFKPFSVQNEIRAKSFDVINTTKKSEKSHRNHNLNDWKTIKELKQKPVVYVKADKGNKLVILDKSEYDSRVQQLINDCDYKKLKKSPLPSMVRECDALRKKISATFGNRYLRTLHVSNPSVGKLYALPKVHKIGNHMRPIVPGINTACYHIAK